MTGDVPLGVEIVVAALLSVSGLAVIVSAIGFARDGEFFLRMHPPAVAYTGGSWCVALAGILYFSTVGARVALHPWLIIILLAITVPVTSLLLARLVLSRRRSAGLPETPPPLTQTRDE